MTYVEFFDKTDSNNISTCLTLIPERVIFIGDNAKVMKKHIANYDRVFNDRGHDVEFIYKTSSKSNLDNAVHLITEIVETYDDCVFDITGGEEIFNLALGIVYEKYPDKNIQIHKFNIRNNMIYDCDKDGNTVYRNLPLLSVEENVRIYGGDVAYGDINSGKTYKWDMNEGFVRDINLIWDICKNNVRYWNAVISVFESMEFVGNTVGEDNLTTVVSKVKLENYLSRHRMKYIVSKGILKYLLKYKLITCFDDSDEEKITVSYKNEQVKKCLTKAGQALEMKIYVTVKELTDSDGNLLYNDVANGVVIDWDGEFHDEKIQDVYDTENEIDILIMHDIVPVFVSCKNGIVTADELYKLNTVAERFGGEYAKKVLVATSLKKMGEAGKYLRQRAEDMRIKIIEDIQILEDEELERKLKNLWLN